MNAVTFNKNFFDSKLNNFKSFLNNIENISKEDVEMLQVSFIQNMTYDLFKTNGIDIINNPIEYINYSSILGRIFLCYAKNKDFSLEFSNKRYYFKSSLKDEDFNFIEEKS